MGTIPATLMSGLRALAAGATFISSVNFCRPIGPATYLGLIFMEWAAVLRPGCFAMKRIYQAF